MIQAFISVSSVCLAAYVAGVVTILGSILVAGHLPGTIFISRRLSYCNEMSCTIYKLHPECQSSLVEVDTEICLSMNNISSTTTYNHSLLECITFKPVKIIKYPTYWERWSNSTLSSLSELDLRSESLRNRKMIFKHVSNFSINSKPLQMDFILKIKYELFKNFNRKRITDVHFKSSLPSWKYFANHISLR